jgi:O-antigen/teichoic acid export membrane protein
MSKLRKLASDTVIYGLSTIIGRAINFLLLPVYTDTDVLSKVDNGILSKVYAWAGFLLVVYTYGMETAFFRFLTKYPDKKQEVFKQVMSLLLFSGLLFSCVLIFFATPITIWLELPGDEHIIYMFACILAIDAFVSIPFAKMRFEQRSKKFALLKLANIVLLVSLVCFFLLFLQGIYKGWILPEFDILTNAIYNPEWGVEYIFLSNLIANSMYLVVLLPDLRKVTIKLDFSLIKQLLIYGLPIGLMLLANVTNDLFSRAFFPKLLPDHFYNDLTSKEALAVLANAYKVAMLITLSVQAFRYAAEPFFFKEANEAEGKATYARVFYVFAIAGAFSILAISLNVDILKYILLRDEVYWRGLPLIPILLTANLFLGLYYNLSVWFKVTDRTYFGPILVGLTAVITIISNVLLIPVMGYFGSALAALIAYFTLCVLTYLFGQKYYPVNYPVVKSLVWLLVALILTAVGWFLPIESIVIKQSLREVLVLLYLGLVYLFLIKKVHIKHNNA